MVVYPKVGKAYIYAWAAKEFKQKAAKIWAGTALNVLKEESGWYEIAKLPEGTYGAYPIVADKWFVDPLEVEQHVVLPDEPCGSAELDDVLDAGLAFLTLLVKYLKKD